MFENRELKQPCGKKLILGKVFWNNVVEGGRQRKVISGRSQQSGTVSVHSRIRDLGPSFTRSVLVKANSPARNLANENFRFSQCWSNLSDTLLQKYDSIKLTCLSFFNEDLVLTLIRDEPQDKLRLWFVCTLKVSFLSIHFQAAQSLYFKRE